MEERCLATLGIIWTLFNFYYVNSIRQEEGKMKIHPLSKSDEGYTRQIIANRSEKLFFSLAFYGLFVAIFLVRLGIKGVDSTIRTGENVDQAFNRINHAFFQASPNNRDNSSSEDEEQTSIPTMNN